MNWTLISVAHSDCCVLHMNWWDIDYITALWDIECISWISSQFHHFPQSLIINQDLVIRVMSDERILEPNLQWSIFPSYANQSLHRLVSLVTAYEPRRPTRALARHPFPSLCSWLECLHKTEQSQPQIDNTWGTYKWRDLQALASLQRERIEPTVSAATNKLNTNWQRLCNGISKPTV